MSEEQFESQLADLEAALASPVSQRRSIGALTEPPLPVQAAPATPAVVPVRVPTFRSLLASEVAQAYAQTAGAGSRGGRAAQVVEYNIGDPFGRTLRRLVDTGIE